MVSMRNFSDEAALSCRKVMPELPATSVNVTGCWGSDKVGADNASAELRKAACCRNWRLVVRNNQFSSAAKYTNGLECVESRDIRACVRRNALPQVFPPIA